MLTGKAEAITKSAMCFLFKHEDFELDLQNPNFKKQGMVSHICNATYH